MTISVGVSFHTHHVQKILTSRPDLSFFEIHCENYMSPGGLSRQLLREIREIYPISAHGVGLSLGSAEGLQEDHLLGLKQFYQEFDPFIVSEHLSWSRHKGAYLNDLLPVPYTQDALDVFIRNISHAQDVFQKRLLIENPSTYLSFKENDYREPDFLKALCDRTGCGLLLDINNVFVSSVNGKLDPQAYLEAISKSDVGQYHLAGHARYPDVYIDDHAAAVCDEVWYLYEFALKKLGQHPTLIEWDNNVPELNTLVGEAHKAKDLMAKAQKLQEESHALKHSA